MIVKDDIRSFINDKIGHKVILFTFELDRWFIVTSISVRSPSLPEFRHRITFQIIPRKSQIFRMDFKGVRPE
jgi:hypothetical protein